MKDTCDKEQESRPLSHTNTTIMAAKQSASKKYMSKRTKKVTKMVAIVTLNFAICWLPAHLFILLIAYIDKNKITHTTYTALALFKSFAHTLSYVTPVLNPISYAFYNENFRQPLTLLFEKVNCKKGNLPQRVSIELSINRTAV